MISFARWTPLTRLNIAQMKIWDVLNRVGYLICTNNTLKMTK